MNYKLKKPAGLNSLIQFIILNSSCIIFLSSCSVQKQISKSANTNVLDAPALQAAHVGISIFEPATGKYWYDYQGDKYFVPASNVKIPTCYAAMKYLGDSLVGMRVFNNDGNLYLFPTGDPSLLHKDFSTHPVFEFLKKSKALNITIVDTVWQEEALGSGWSWDDYNEAFLAERSSLPVFGNIFELSGTPQDFHSIPAFKFNYQSEGREQLSNVFREQGVNRFSFRFRGEKREVLRIPFATMNGETNRQILSDTLRQIIIPHDEFIPGIAGDTSVMIIHSQPTDSILKPMMHRSDNFFAEQTLLMVSNERLGIMNDEKIIDTLLKTDLNDFPQEPRWVDGSGLSRYNLFSPRDFVFILNKMKNEFGMERVKRIFPTGGQGTLANYYIADSNYVYAKTGTLSGVVALSGYLYTKKGKELIFSVLVNNHRASGTEVRRAVEKFLERLRTKY